MAKPKKIPPQNYLIALLSVIAALLLTLYAFEWYKKYESERLSESYLISSQSASLIQSLDDFNNAFLIEPPSEYFLYISYTGDKNIYNLEKELAKVIKEYGLTEEFYFLNITDIKNDKDFFTQLNKTLNLPFKINTVPIILYYRNGSPLDDVSSTNQIITAADFRHLIDKFEISKE